MGVDKCEVDEQETIKSRDKGRLILDGIERMIEEVGKKEKNMWPATTELRQDRTGYC